MINVYLEGRFPQADRIDQFVRDVMFHFFKNRMKRDIDVTVKMNRVIIDDEGNFMSGLCDGDRNEVFIDVARGDCVSTSGDYERYDVRTIASTIAHELVHGKQWIRGEIQGDGETFKGVDYSHLDYEDQPWEVEAYGLEEELTQLYWDKK